MIKKKVPNSHLVQNSCKEDLYIFSDKEEGELEETKIPTSLPKTVSKNSDKKRTNRSKPFDWSKSNGLAEKGMKESDSKKTSEQFLYQNKSAFDEHVKKYYIVNDQDDLEPKGAISLWMKLNLT